MEHKKTQKSTRQTSRNKTYVAKKNTNITQNRNSYHKKSATITQTQSAATAKKTQHTQITQGTKAYKLLALQCNISTNKAKDLIDSGRVSVKGKRLPIARTLLPLNTKFDVLTTPCAMIFEDNDIVALDKSVGVESYNLLKTYPHYKLINRLDKDTSGVILLAKNEKMRQNAIQAFKQKKVEKVYFALIEGKVYEEIVIEKKISTQKDSKAKSHINDHGLHAQSIVTPVQTFTHTTLVSVQIPTGRTHQIRIHLASIKHPIVGDIIYNKTSKIKAKRLMLHCQKTSLLGYRFESGVDIHEAFEIND